MDAEENRVQVLAEEWLLANDERLFLRRTRIREARRQFEAEEGLLIHPSDWRRARSRCTYWKKMRRRRWPADRLLTEQQWDALRMWAQENEEAIAQCRSPGMAAQLALRAGVKASPSILRDSFSFMAIWRRTRARLDCNSQPQEVPN